MTNVVAAPVKVVEHSSTTILSSLVQQNAADDVTSSLACNLVVVCDGTPQNSSTSSIDLVSFAQRCSAKEISPL